MTNKDVLKYVNETFETLKRYDQHVNEEPRQVFLNALKDILERENGKQVVIDQEMYKDLTY